MNYEKVITKLDGLISAKSKKARKEIIAYDSLKLAEYGNNDVEGYQIFTPSFIVENMLDAIGGEEIENIERVILEPTSGDGAFTTKIVERRIKKVIESGNHIELNTLKALSTLYSIEMDEQLIKKQRNNIFTVINHLFKENSIEVDSLYYEIVKCIISENYIWAMFNSDNEITMLVPDLAYKMPEAEKGKKREIQLPVWNINADDISVCYEDVEVY